MTDPEAPFRIRALEKLCPYLECIELAGGRRQDGSRAQFDILARPRAESLTDISVVFEVKAWPSVSDDKFGPWIKQAADYVHARPDNGWPDVAAAFLWLVGVEMDERSEDRSRMLGMIQLAQHFRVGLARHFERTGLDLTFGISACLFSERRGGWTPRAGTLLRARRVSGGQRLPLAARDRPYP